MTKNNMNQTDETVLRIEGDMNIYRAHELKEALLDPLSHAAILEVDLSAVTELDTSGLQILMLAKRIAKEKKAELRLVAHSPAVLEVFELLNLASYFGDPLVVQPRAASART